MSLLRWTLPLIAAVVAFLPATAHAADRSFGVWKNPSGSVHVRAEPCGDKMCGTVVWANDKAIADARRGGTDNLIGLQLFRGFGKSRVRSGGKGGRGHPACMCREMVGDRCGARISLRA